jgi:hypothetical protein
LRASKIQKTERRDNVGGADVDDDHDGGDDDHVDLGSKIRGQLGIELLADVERSCLKEVNNKRIILGLTVEVTLVCIIFQL